MNDFRCITIPANIVAPAKAGAQVSNISFNLKLKTWIPAFAGMTILFSSLSALASPPSVQLRTDVSPKEIYIGDVIRYQITVAYSSSVTPGALELPKDLGGFEVLNLATSKPEPVPPDKLTLQHDLALTIFSTGTQTIPALTLKFSTTDGHEAEAETSPISIKVKSLLQEKGDLGNIRPLKGLYDFRSYLWVWILLGVVAVGVAAFFLVRWMKRRALGGANAKPALPPEETAWDALQDLEHSDLLAKGQIKEFYFQLSVILRGYLEGRYQISALDRTTSELLMEFRRLNLSLSLVNLCREFFDNADLVKFAKMTPSEDEIAGDLNRLKQFLTLTAPQKKSETADVAGSESIPV